MIKVEVDWTIKVSVIRRLAKIGLYWPPNNPGSPSLESYTNKPRRAVAYLLLSISLEVLALLLMWVLANAPSFSLGPILSLLLALALASYFALWFADRSKRWSYQLIQQDPRPPIVCLRAFGDDSKDSFTDNSRFFINPLTLIRRWFYVPDPQHIFGIHLRTKLSPYGPLIVLGNPKRDRPVMGPDETRVPNEKWQEEVSSHLDRARLILVFAGISNGLFWELTQIACRQNPVMHKSRESTPSHHGRAMKKSTDELSSHKLRQLT